MKVAIIEDEIRTARTLQRILTKDHACEVVQIISSIEEGIEFFDQDPQLDLIFSDIEISDGLCFDLFKEVEVKCPIIFCTAYNQYALAAFKANGIDYIVKPFSEQDIGDAMAKFKRLVGATTPENETKRLLDVLKSTLQPPKKGAILVSFREKTFPVEVSNIAYFFVKDEATYLYTAGQEYLTQRSLDELEQTYGGRQFYRANRQYIINRDFIKEVEQFFARKLAVKLTVPVKEGIIVSKAKASSFMNWLES
jgi:two-component system, LytTR family, response regulator LytT